MVATKLVPIETSSKVVVGPLASGDPQVTLFHMECLPQALVIADDRSGSVVLQEAMRRGGRAMHAVE